MRDGWIETSFSAFASLEKGISYKSSELCDEGEGMPFINLKSIDRGGGYRSDGLKWYSGKFKTSQVVEPGDLILCCTDLTKQKAILGYPILVPAIGYSRFCISLDLAKILVDDKLIMKSFLFLLLQDRRMREFMQSRSSGTTVMHLKTSEVPVAQVALPPLPEQKRIIDLISSVDSYIEALRQQLENAKRSRNAVLHELLAVGSDDWVETTIGDISTFISIRKAPNQLSSNSIYVGLEHLEPNITSINNFDSTSKVSSSLTPFDVGDVLFGRLRPYLHKVALAEMKGFCSPEILVLRANPNVLPQMLLLYCDADSTIKICVERSAGTRMPRTSTDDLASIEVQLPPMPQQEQLADLFGAFDANIARLNISLEKTQQLRSGILSDLLSGQHEIPASYDKVMGAA